MSALQGACAAIALTALAVRLGGRQHRLLHLFQLEHYEPARLLLWLGRRGELLAVRELLAAGLLFAAAGISAADGSGFLAGGLLLLSTPSGILGVRDWRRGAVKPLVPTARARRLLTVAIAPPVLVALASIALVAVGLTPAALAVLLAAGWVLLALAPHTLLAANAILRPVQSAIDRPYVNSARRALRDWPGLTIGITGSYGKTTTKFCVGEVLGAEMPTLVTPESFNSYLGVVRTVNERLEERHRAFVVEMGMYRRGDIQELCELVHPTIGVITAIGPAHLERLSSIEEIAAAKAELALALPADGHLVTNADDPRCMAIAESVDVPVTLFGVQSPAAQVRARDVRLAGGRTEFELCVNGLTLGVSAQLLGPQNVFNLLAAGAVGTVLGIEPQKIAEALSRVPAPEHRLQPIHNRQAGIVVIDDAYNSNPEGAAAALEVLRAHEAKRRLLVTPGMVELGELEPELNRRFGEQAGRVCDLVILVGPKRTRPIYEGLMHAGMDPSDVHVVGDLAQASSILSGLTRSGDLVLFENDLPDTYAEDPVAAGAPERPVADAARR